MCCLWAFLVNLHGEPAYLSGAYLSRGPKKLPKSTQKQTSHFADDLTADCVRNTRSLGSEKIEHIVQYTKQRYNIGGSSSRTHGGTACISTSGTLKFDFSQLMDTSAWVHSSYMSNELHLSNSSSFQAPSGFRSLHISRDSPRPLFPFHSHIPSIVVSFPMPLIIPVFVQISARPRRSYPLGTHAASSSMHPDTSLAPVCCKYLVFTCKYCSAFRQHGRDLLW